MRHSKTYPISKLINQIIRSSDQRLSEFVQTLGYKRINKSLRVLETWLLEGEGDRLFVDRLLKAYPLHQNEINDALRETQKILLEERRILSEERAEKIRLMHQPCLVVQTDEKCPSQIAFYILFGRNRKVVPLPKRIIELPYDRSFEIVSWTIKRYLDRYHHQCPMWGEVRGFLYSVKPDRGFLFSCEGEVIAEQNELPPVLRAALEVRIAGRRFQLPRTRS